MLKILIWAYNFKLFWAHNFGRAIFHFCVILLLKTHQGIMLLVLFLIQLLVWLSHVAPVLINVMHLLHNYFLAISEIFRKKFPQRTEKSNYDVLRSLVFDRECYWPTYRNGVLFTKNFRYKYSIFSCLAAKFENIRVASKPVPCFFTRILNHFFAFQT